MRSTRGILSLLLALLSGNAAAEWVAVGRGDTIYAAFADQAGIRRNGTLASMSGLYDFRKQDFTPEGKGLYSTVVLREYDCGQRQVRLLSSIDFSGLSGANSCERSARLIHHRRVDHAPVQREGAAPLAHRRFECGDDFLRQRDFFR